MVAPLRFTYSNSQNLNTQPFRFASDKSAPVKSTFQNFLPDKSFPRRSDFLKDYTVSDIKESVTLSSSYAKRIYRALRYLKRNNQPAWIVSLEDFRAFVNLPESYKMGNIDQRVLEPSIKELSRFFPNLKVEKLYSAKAKRGRPSVLGLKFTFDKVSTRRKKDNYDGGTIDRY